MRNEKTRCGFFLKTTWQRLRKKQKPASFTVPQGSPVEQCASIKPARKAGEQIE